MGRNSLFNDRRRAQSLMNAIEGKLPKKLRKRDMLVKFGKGYSRSNTFGNKKSTHGKSAYKPGSRAARKRQAVNRIKASLG